MTRAIDLPLQPNGSKVQWSYLPKQFSADSIDTILSNLRELLPTGDLTLGKPVEEFEERFATLIGARYAIGVGSGTDAIKLSLKALGVGPGDEVVTTANTFIATVGALAELYAIPRFVDCTDDFCMDVADVQQVEDAVAKDYTLTLLFEGGDLFSQRRRRQNLFR
jgi:aminotransferase EvaB